MHLILSGDTTSAYKALVILLNYLIGQTLTLIVVPNCLYAGPHSVFHYQKRFA